MKILDSFLQKEKLSLSLGTRYCCGLSFGSVCVCVCVCVCVLVILSILTLCDSLDCNLPGSSVHGILQAIILEWVAISFSRGFSWPRDWTDVYFVLRDIHLTISVIPWEDRLACQVKPQEPSILDSRHNMKHIYFILPMYGSTVLK